MTTSLMTKLAAIVSVSLLAVFATGCANEGLDDDGDDVVEEDGDEEQGSSESALKNTIAKACSSGYGCLYADSNFGGRRLQFHDIGCQNLNGFNDQTSSLYNRSGHRFGVYSGKNCTGTARVFKPGAKVSTLGTFSNKATSIRLY